MVETKVPKDVRSYKTKIIGPFSLRQIICIVAAVIFDAILYFLSQAIGIELTMEVVIYVVMFLDLPILAFMLTPQGMPMEQYLLKVIFANFTKPSKRKVETLLYEDQKQMPLTKKELQEREKRINSIGRKNPDLKPYR